MLAAGVVLVTFVATVVFLPVTNAFSVVIVGEAPARVDVSGCGKLTHAVVADGLVVGMFDVTCEGEATISLHSESYSVDCVIGYVTSIRRSFGFRVEGDHCERVETIAFVSRYSE